MSEQQEQKTDSAVADAIRELASAIRDGSTVVSDQLQEIDESLIAILSRGQNPDEPVMTMKDAIERITDIGAKAVLTAITNWESKLNRV